MTKNREISRDPERAEAVKTKHFAALQPFLLHALLLATLLGLFGNFLLDYGFLRPTDTTQVIDTIRVEATGDKSMRSKGSEVWFYGAFSVSDGRRIPWDQVELDASWLQRGDAYVAPGDKPSTATLTYRGATRLEFGSHPYSGVVLVKWGENQKKINLYSSATTTKPLTIDGRSSYTNSSLYPLILGCFVLIGIGLAAGIVHLGWKYTYHCIFFLSLVFSLYLTIAAFFPGVYTNDSADQLKQALTGTYHDWHPPIMSWLWSLLITTTSRIESLFFLHLLLLLAGALVWARVFQRLNIGYLAFAIPIFVAGPTVMNFSGVVWKDVGFAFALLLACGVISLAWIRNSLSWIDSILASMLLVYAFGVRPNGIFSIMPIVGLLAWLAVRQCKPLLPKIGKLTASAFASIVIILAMVGGMHAFTYTYLDAQKRYPIQYLELYDIAGISSISGQDYFPDFIKNVPQHDLPLIAAGYSQSISVFGNANNLVFSGPEGSQPLVPLNTDPDQQALLRKAWLSAIFDETFAYLQHRMAVMKSMFLVGAYPTERPQNATDRTAVLEANGVRPEQVELPDYQLPGAQSAQEFVADSTVWATQSDLYTGWIWVVLLTLELMAGLIMAVKSIRSGVLIIMASGSGLLYALPYLIIAPASDFRYLYWSTLAAGICTILMAGQLSARMLGKIRRRYQTQPLVHPAH
ncbi:hypothetical protein [Achromobacter deleyi]|uniref:hypothetical protein n=1 Tax=Achromobacter deleyi TaxID=1353891 RepID=UPI001468BE66|nr:hypothetical protein [Achromobacter deleyi]CAB3889258.1 hypothetical protein LMG3412_03665 [Achromobacter deleyi]